MIPLQKDMDLDESRAEFAHGVRLAEHEAGGTI